MKEKQIRVKQKATKETKIRGNSPKQLTFVTFVSFCSMFPKFRGIVFIGVYGVAKPMSMGAFSFRVFTITALAGCTFTSLYLICSTGCKQNSYDFLGLTTDDTHWGTHCLPACVRAPRVYVSPPPAKPSYFSPESTQRSRKVEDALRKTTG